MKFALAAILLVVVAQTAMATTYTYAGGTGNWNNTAMWGGAAYPGQVAGVDSAVFNTTGAVTSSSSYTLIDGTFDAPMTMNVTGGTLRFNGMLSGAGKITKTGSGTLRFNGGSTSTSDLELQAGKVILSGSTPIHGNVKMTGGTLQFYDSDMIATTSTMEMSGGFINFSSAHQVMDTFTLSGNAGMNALLGGDVHFANSSAIAWTGTLNVEYIGVNTGADPTNTTVPGVGSLFFGTDTTGLTADQLAKITFVELNENFDKTGNTFAAMWDPAGNGKIVPTPEPATLGLLLLGGLSAFARRRRSA